MRLILLTVVLIVAGSLAKAQEPKGFRYHDSLTYNLYLEGRWKDLAEASKEALSEGHDFYYMRMRLGTAWYERSFYAAAAKQFRKALEFNNNDPAATEYLFYCRLLSGEVANASRMLSFMTPEHRRKVLDESRLAKNTVWLSFYYNDFDTDEIVSDPSAVFADYEAGTTTVARLLTNPSITMSHMVSPGVYYIHSFNNIIKQNLLHYYDGIRTIDLKNQKVIQNQYYGSFIIAGAGGFSFRPWVHLSLTMYDYILAGGSMSPGFYAVRRTGKIH